MSRFERWSVWGTSILVAVSGTGYLWMKYFLEAAGPFAVVNHPLQPWLLKIHILSAPLFVFAMGMIGVKHAWNHFRLGVRWGRKTGIATGASAVAMVFTGYLIQAVAAEGWLTAMVVSHIATSYLFLAALGAHQWIVRSAPSAPRNPSGVRRTVRRREAAPERQVHAERPRRKQSVHESGHGGRPPGG